MPYDAVLFQALVAIETNQAQIQAKQPKELCPEAPQLVSIECKGIGGKCVQPFNPDRTDKDSSLWCPHELAAMPVFRALEKAAEQVKKSGAYEAFCEAVFGTLRSNDKGGAPHALKSNIKQMSRGCYKITKPKAWSCNAGAWQNVKDIFRISLEFDDLPKLYQGAKKLVEKIGVIGAPVSGASYKGYTFGPIYRIKDRFATPPLVGEDSELEVLYKDYQVILGVCGPFSWGSTKPYLIELQLHVQSMLEQKHIGGHALYKKMRVLPLDQKKRLLELVEGSNILYGQGFQADKTGGLNADIDYVDPELVQAIAAKNLSPTFLMQNWNKILEQIYKSQQTR
jgi:hypothetical protein